MLVFAVVVPNEKPPVRDGGGGDGRGTKTGPNAAVDAAVVVRFVLVAAPNEKPPVWGGGGGSGGSGGHNKETGLNAAVDAKYGSDIIAEARNEKSSFSSDFDLGGPEIGENWFMACCSCAAENSNGFDACEIFVDVDSASSDSSGRDKESLDGTESNTATSR